MHSQIAAEKRNTVQKKNVICSNLLNQCVIENNALVLEESIHVSLKEIES
jgi:hypothetical protein